MKCVRKSWVEKSNIGGGGGEEGRKLVIKIIIIITIKWNLFTEIKLYLLCICYYYLQGLPYYMPLPLVGGGQSNPVT